MATRLRSMSDRHRRAGQKAHAEGLCPLCGGAGRLSACTRSDAGRKGGNRTVLASRQPGAMSMSERSKRARRPRALTLEDLGEP